MSSARSVLLSLCSAVLVVAGFLLRAFLRAALHAALLPQATLGADPFIHFTSIADPFIRFTSISGSSTLKKTDEERNKTPSSGFFSGSIGQYQDQVYGLTLCRGDTSPSDCKACVADAGAEIRRHCPRNKWAIIWYDDCMFKYLDTDFFGQIDNANKFYMWNLKNVSDPEAFNGKVWGLLTGLVEEAYTVPKLYATGEMGLEDKTKLYGLVQCTRDLSATECKECLEGAIGELPSCCDGKEGGRGVGGSCNFRYEIYPFVNV
ncbi:cysteine-rich repeat secretory protein 38-like [Eucalyptus grandis]|uniref:cysteine-rich repeat secretory protein 38-like n=1 Tax=Eucalyptus grandis TaxID=71139 RepID=UPI00192EE8B5|nr:cysteine-rich repeat secretory protein 38-like [Eucalyptus grandis]